MLWFTLRKLQSPDSESRSSAAYRLAHDRKLRPALPRAFQPLITALSDIIPSVRAEAAYALAVLGDRRSIGPLVGALDDADEKVRENAAWALYYMFPTRDSMTEEFRRRNQPDAERLLDVIAVALTFGICRCQWETLIVGETAVREYLGHMTSTLNGGPGYWLHYCKRWEAEWHVADDYSNMRRLRYIPYPWPSP